MPYMIKENWLVIYQTTDSIKNILTRWINEQRINQKCDLLQKLITFMMHLNKSLFFFFEELRQHANQKNYLRDNIAFLSKTINLLKTKQ
jgi:acyl carrier protein phosphodiesterase